MSTHFVAKALLMCVAVLGTGLASAQNYPNKPIRISTSGVGGGNDFNSRVIAQGISGPLGQQVIVDNKPTPLAAGEFVAKAPADGYSLLYNGSGLWLLPFLRDNVPFDVPRDFAPITLAVSLPNIVTVHPSLPVRSIKELIALAKAKPGELSYATGSTATSSYFAGAQFKIMTGVNMENILYKAGSAQIADMLSGRVPIAFIPAASVAPLVKSGKLRALAVTTTKPSALLPDVPTVAATGLPGYESVATQGLWVPIKTAIAIINRLNKEIVLVLNQPETKEKMLAQGVETIGSTPEEFSAFIKSNMTEMSKIIKDAGIREE